MKFLNCSGCSGDIETDETFEEDEDNDSTPTSDSRNL
jgi:hypothetical protein